MVIVAVAASGELSQFEPKLIAVMETIEYAPPWRAALRGHTDWVNAVAFSPDGTRVASGSDDYTVRIWEVATGKELLAIDQPGFVTGVAFAPSGAQVAAANTDGSVEIWDAASGAEVLRIEAHDGYVLSVAFSPDGAHLASSGDDYLVRVWDAATGEAQVTLEGHEAAVNGVAYSPDGTRMASASDDATVRIWDASTGGQLLSIEHPDWVNAVAFSPDQAVYAATELGGWYWAVKAQIHAGARGKAGGRTYPGMSAGVSMSRREAGGTSRRWGERRPRMARAPWSPVSPSMSPQAARGRMQGGPGAPSG